MNYLEYVTVTDLKAEKDITGTTDDALLLERIREASRMIDRAAHRAFAPKVETRSFDVPHARQENILWLDQDLLEVVTLTNGDGGVLTTNEYRLVPVNGSPKQGLQMKAASTVAWQPDSSGETVGVIALAGRWGYHSQYAPAGSGGGAWDALTTLGAALNGSATSATLIAGVGDPGELWQIDDELLYLSARTTTAATLVRGVNGSTAAAHDNGKTIYRWKPEADIVELARSAAKALYLLRDGNPLVDTITVDGQTFATPRHVDKFVEKRIQSMGLRRTV